MAGLNSKSAFSLQRARQSSRFIVLLFSLSVFRRFRTHSAHCRMANNILTCHAKNVLVVEM